MQRDFEIFLKPSAASIAVKRGFSWPGFFFIWIWAFSRGLFLPGILVLLADAIIFSLKLTVLANNPVACVLISLLLQVFVGIKGNFWRCRKLEREGYDFSGIISASSPARAIALYSRGETAKSISTGFSFGFFPLPGGCQRILAMTWLTWKAAVRFRLFLVIAALLLIAVVGLPMIIKDDGTASGFTQIILTYTLSAVTVLLGISTLWLSCGTLARDIEECQIQVVATKPIARWQIWLGKWFGIASLNIVLLVLAGVCIYGGLEWRASKLPAAEQAQLRQEVLVARGSAKEQNYDDQIDAETEQVLQDRLKTTPVAAADLPEVRQQIREQVQASYEVVGPTEYRTWKIDLGYAKNYLANKPMQLRVKFNTPNLSPSGAYLGLWQVGDQNSTNFVQLAPMSIAPDAYHEFPIPPNLLDSKGVLTVVFLNENPTAMVFPLEDGMEVLYPEGGFTTNFIRALGIIFCWLTLLSAVGLMSASFLSFPVATFFSLTLLIVALSNGTIADTIMAGTMATNGAGAGAPHSVMDPYIMPLLKVILLVLGLVVKFSPITALSTGHCITWGELAAAFVQMVLFLGGIFVIAGILFFSRRELAAAQNQ